MSRKASFISLCFLPANINSWQHTEGVRHSLKPETQKTAKRSQHSPALSRQRLRRRSLSAMKRRRPQRPHPLGDIQRGPWRKEAGGQDNVTWDMEKHVRTTHGFQMPMRNDFNKRLKAVSNKISSVLQHLCQSINGQNKICVLSLHKGSSWVMKVGWGLQGSPILRHWHPPFKKRRGGRNRRQMFTRISVDMKMTISPVR